MAPCDLGKRRQSWGVSKRCDIFYSTKQQQMPHQYPLKCHCWMYQKQWLIACHGTKNQASCVCWWLRMDPTDIRHAERKSWSSTLCNRSGRLRREFFVAPNWFTCSRQAFPIGTFGGWKRTKRKVNVQGYGKAFVEFLAE
jgi:hypothetical protein